ncbi:MAG: T9SS type A sorting domain-containing protein [Bacteroidetes bacterium]|nr:T9SS type A sorting domain-containing protein [Bacteroidota bacterium]
MRRLVFLSFILFYFVAKPQAQNLIQNGSFEIFDSIDCGGGGFDNYSMIGTPHVVNNWYSLNSPDYFNSTCFAGGFNVPYSYFGHCYSKQGNAYAGGIAFTGNYETKEYIYQQLSVPLQAGKIYCLSFYASRADGVTHAVNNIGAYFSASIPPLVSNYYVNATPQVLNQSGFITDTISWTEIQGCFTALGGEQYITIGNFNSNANTDTLFVGSVNQTPSTFKYAYYYIDDVTLIDQSTVGFNELDKGKSFDIYPNPTNSILNIESNNQQLQNATIEMKNTLGQIVYFDVYAHQIHISDLPSGIYFITINNKETKRTIKFVKD